MPKRVIDFDAMWGSDKLAACAAWAQGEYAWLYGLADASGCFETTNLRVIWGRVAAIRANLTIERLEQVFAEFQDKGLLFVWEHEGKRYAHWTGSDVPGRLPPPSWRMRLEKFAPPVPKQRLAEYMARFARGRAALGGMGFRGEAQREPCSRQEDLRFEISDLDEEPGNVGREAGSQIMEQRLPVTGCGANLGNQKNNLKDNLEAGEPFATSAHAGRLAAAAAAVSRRDGTGIERYNIAGGNGLKRRVERAQGQDWDWNSEGNWNGDWEADGNRRRSDRGKSRVCPTGTRPASASDSNTFCNSNSQAKANSLLVAKTKSAANASSIENSNSGATSDTRLNSDLRAAPQQDLQCLSGSGSDRRAKDRAGERFVERGAGGSEVSYPAVRVEKEAGWSAGASRWREKELAVERELRVGAGPVCGPARVKPEVLERIRRREAARAGTRSP
jgi:hypothetical protein